MKKVVSILALLIFTAFSFGEIVDEDGYTKDIVEAKVQKFKNLRTTGFVMLGSGGTLLISGIICISSAEWESYSTYGGGGVTTNDPVGGAGIIMTAVGVPLTVAGIVLSSIGRKKYREYSTRLQMFSGYNPRSNEFRAGISYRF
ncbi:MAG: hypothetical protein ACM31E_04900 [Fibrobacterota bacterium]|nr:hypothetical protein [Chitinispirillaceae bacterium]